MVPVRGLASVNRVGNQSLVRSNQSLPGVFTAIPLCWEGLDFSEVERNGLGGGVFPSGVSSLNPFESALESSTKSDAVVIVGAPVTVKKGVSILALEKTRKTHQVSRLEARLSFWLVENVSRRGRNILMSSFNWIKIFHDSKIPLRGRFYANPGKSWESQQIPIALIFNLGNFSTV